jgi:23S rRNA (pseudouridine1915-N3)-methyltransferase
LKLSVITIGSAGRVLEPAIAEYETRARRYWPLDIIEVNQERARPGSDGAEARNAEGVRLLRRIPDGAELIALTREGDEWDSERLSQHIQDAAVRAQPGIAFMIGGAYGLSDSVLKHARHRMRLSSFTLTHDIARLVLLEQIYRAGTIARGEPYHKRRDG